MYVPLGKIESVSGSDVFIACLRMAIGLEDGRK